MNEQRKWLKNEMAYINRAVNQIKLGKSIYSQVKRLKNGIFHYRSWESIRAQINKVRNGNKSNDRSPY